MKQLWISPIAALATAVLSAGAAHAGSNAGALAYLSWDATSQVTDTAAAARNDLYVRLEHVGTPLAFKGAELDVTWEPAGNYVGCFDLVNVVYKTSQGTTCTYLNRGSAVPVSIIDANHAHLAWANTSCLTLCTAGDIVQMQFQTDQCGDPTGCFTLNSVSVLDCLSRLDYLAIASNVVTVGGGGTHQCGQATPADTHTWGQIKSLYVR